MSYMHWRTQRSIILCSAACGSGIAIHKDVMDKEESIVLLMKGWTPLLWFWQTEYFILICISHKKWFLLHVLWMALFSWVPIFMDWTKMTFVGVKICGHGFFFVLHTENYHFMDTGICGSDPPRKPRKLVPNEL